MNDTEYGGAGGQYAIVSLDPNANEVIAHELMGHSFAKLGDEYTDPYPSFPDIEEPNTEMDSTEDRRQEVGSAHAAEQERSRHAGSG